LRHSTHVQDDVSQELVVVEVAVLDAAAPSAGVLTARHILGGHGALLSGAPVGAIVCD